MPKFKVEFIHVEETTYTGWIESDSEKEAYQKVSDKPFNIEDLLKIEVQGIEAKDIYIDEVVEDE